ncbi:Dph6-related ATP pyrophosphatase [Breznakiellaceae bacterium SP9]
MNKKIKLAASYSGGKDSALALYRAMKLDYEPVCLLTTYNANAGRSWFHGVPTELLNNVAESIGLPLELVTTGPTDDYGPDFERALAKLKIEYDVNVCAFGDIDIQAHHDWCDARCRNTGIESLFPLWDNSREELVFELIDSGFKAVITIVNSTMLSAKYLGKTLTRELAADIAACGADICGENGEYHSFVYDGPLFKKPININFGELLTNGNYSILPIMPATI